MLHHANSAHPAHQELDARLVAGGTLFLVTLFVLFICRCVFGSKRKRQEGEEILVLSWVVQAAASQARIILRATAADIALRLTLQLMLYHAILPEDDRKLRKEFCQSHSWSSSTDNLVPYMDPTNSLDRCFGAAPSNHYNTNKCQVDDQITGEQSHVGTHFCARHIAPLYDAT